MGAIPRILAKTFCCRRQGQPIRESMLGLAIRDNDSELPFRPHQCAAGADATFWSAGTSLGCNNYPPSLPMGSQAHHSRRLGFQASEYGAQVPVTDQERAVCPSDR